MVGLSSKRGLLTDPEASPVRPTRDVEVIIEIATALEYQALEKDLRSLGFQPDLSEGAPIPLSRLGWCHENPVPLSLRAFHLGTGASPAAITGGGNPEGPMNP
jgi:hypothetical protein